MIVRVRKGSTTNEWRHVEAVEVDFAYPNIAIHKHGVWLSNHNITKGESVYIVEEKKEGEE